MILLALILLHAPDGHQVWVAPSQIASVEPFEDKAIGAHTLIKTLAGDRYVADRAEDVVQMLKAPPCAE